MVADVLRAAENVHVEMEPHVVWKAGDFLHLDDEDHERSPRAYRWIRGYLGARAGSRMLVEKSPPNCLRPHTVHRVFPDARILYVTRAPQDCLHSNYVRSLRREALSPKTVAHKYLHVGSDRRAREAGGFRQERHAIGGAAVWQQLRLADSAAFGVYALRLTLLRWRLPGLPFGPKLDRFADVVRQHGLRGYHQRCLLLALEKAVMFRELYEDCMQVVSLEELMARPEGTIERILTFAECDMAENQRREIAEGIRQRPAGQASTGWLEGEIGRSEFERWMSAVSALTVALR